MNMRGRRCVQARARRFQVILGFCVPADDARPGVAIIRPERGEFHDVLHAGPLRGVDERSLLLDLICVVRRQQQRLRRETYALRLQTARLASQHTAEMRGRSNSAQRTGRRCRRGGGPERLSSAATRPQVEEENAKPRRGFVLAGMSGQSEREIDDLAG